MLRRCVVWLQEFSTLSGGPVVGLAHGAGKRAVIQPSIVDAEINQSALEAKMSSLLARELTAEKAEEVQPPLKRAWVKAPVSQLSTSISRRDWFRLMSFNMMTDAWGPARTTPVEAVRVRVPSFTRQGSSSSTSHSEGDDGFCDYDSDKDPELPPFLSPEFRRKHLMTLLRHYDPDIVCLNEVNRTFFNTEMWKYVRFLGYGNLFQSSRGARVRALRKGDLASAPPNRNKIPEEEDIGNVVLFHKGRFFPLMMPGRDIGRHFHFAHFVGMRDKVTNMTLYVACVQLTAGASAEAAQVRAHEARQVLTLLEAMTRNDSDRSHLSCVVCGDLNNHDDEEPCVELLRGKFFSAHDLIGGPRWTAWHHRDTQQSDRYAPYLRKNVEEMHRYDGEYAAEEEIQRFQRADTGYHGKSSRVRLVRDEIAQKAAPAAAPATAPATSQAAPPENGTAAPTTTDQLALLKETRDARGITFNTQDFVFYDPRSLALHQVLDVPDDAEVEEAQLFPSHKLPSHHLPLLVDVSWNDTFPDVAATSLKS